MKHSLLKLRCLCSPTDCSLIVCVFEFNSVICPIGGALVVLPTLHGISQRVQYMNFMVIAVVRGLLMLPWKRPPWGLANVHWEEQGMSGHDEGWNPTSEDLRAIRDDDRQRQHLSLLLSLSNQEGVAWKTCSCACEHGACETVPDEYTEINPVLLGHELFIVAPFCPFHIITSCASMCVTVHSHIVIERTAWVSAVFKFLCLEQLLALVTFIKDLSTFPLKLGMKLWTCSLLLIKRSPKCFLPSRQKARPKISAAFTSYFFSI